MQPLTHCELNSHDDSEYFSIRIPKDQLCRAVANEYEIQLPKQSDFLDYSEY